MPGGVGMGRDGSEWLGRSSAALLPLVAVALGTAVVWATEGWRVAAGAAAVAGLAGLGLAALQLRRSRHARAGHAERAFELQRAHARLAQRAARGEALASLGRAIAEGLEAAELRERAVAQVDVLLAPLRVAWLQRGGHAWSVRAERGAPGDARSDRVSLERAESREQARVEAGPRGDRIVSVVAMDQGAAALVVELDGAAKSHDAELVEAVLHLVATALRHRAAVAAATQGERELADMVQGSPDAIVTVGPAGTVAMCNPAAERLLGRGRDEIVGLPLDALGFDLSGDDDPISDASTDSRLSTFQIVRPDGERRDLEVNVRVATTGGGPCLQLVARDVTARRRAQRERRELARRLAASQRMEALGALAGGVAHDFGNLLTVLMSVRVLLESEPLTPSAKALVTDMGDVTDRANGLVRQLLTFAREQPGQPRELDVAAVVRGLRPLLSRLVGPEIALSIDAPGPCVARVDGSQLEQVVMNLAVNARDAMPEGGALSLTVRVEDGAGRLEVSDTGVGMDPATAARIFEPFFTTKGNDRGTGLGLATVHGIAQQWGGAVDVRSELGRGTTFEIVFPLASGGS